MLDAHRGRVAVQLAPALADPASLTPGPPLTGACQFISQATGYRYLHEALDVIADRAPHLHQVLAAGALQGWEHVCLDGTLIGATRSSARSQTGADLWYPGKHRRHGGNIQVLTDPTGFPVDQRGRTGLDPHHRRPRPRPGCPVPGRRGRDAHPGRQGPTSGLSMAVAKSPLVAR